MLMYLTNDAVCLVKRRNILSKIPCGSLRFFALKSVLHLVPANAYREDAQETAERDFFGLKRFGHYFCGSCI